MKRLKQIVSFSLMGFSILIILSSLKLGIGDLRSPGPGFMGLIASILLFILSLVVFIQDTLGSAETLEIPLNWTNFSKQFIITVGLCFYALSLEYLGFLVSSFILMWIMFLVDSPKKWLYHLIIAIIVINISYFVLSKLLGVVFPSGSFHIQW